MGAPELESTAPQVRSTLRERLRRVHERPIFQWFTATVIVISALSIGASSYKLPELVSGLLRLLDYGITIYFVFEIGLRFLAAPSSRDFFRDRWNIFDTLIVCGSLIPLDGSESLFLGRLLRLFRVLRLISFVPQLRVLVEALLLAIPRMSYLALLMFIIFYMYGCLGNLFFRNSDPAAWRDVGTAMLTLFQIATFDNWAHLMRGAMHYSHPLSSLSWIYFLSFIFLIAFVFFNMMIGIILQVFEEGEAARATDQLQENGVVMEQVDSTQADILRGQLERIEKQLAEIDQRLRERP